jgi:hypothetical protein
MKVESVVGPKINITEPREALPIRLEGKLAQDQSGQLLLQTRDGEAIPVRLMGIDLPLGQEMSFELAGREGQSLVYRAGTADSNISRFELLLKSWGMNADQSWQEMMSALYQEGLPLTKDNLFALERNLRLIRQEWGLQINPRILAMLMAKGIPVRPLTVLLTLYRTVPELRQEIAQAIGLQLAEVDTTTAETIEETLPSINRHQVPDDGNVSHVWQGLFGPVVCRTDDQGEIHWPLDDSRQGKRRPAEKFGFEMIPPCIGLVEVDVEWGSQGSKVTLTVERDYLEVFQQAIPPWQRSLNERGIPAVVFVQAFGKQHPDLPTIIDGRA